jgi:NAD-dependent dihydropyrimidine dehydrogenase PreA subunit
VSPFRRESGTAFIRLDTSACTACWKCYDACHKHVLGKIKFFGHKHIKIASAELCAGCLKCVKVCASGAITAIPQRKGQA